MAFKLTKVEVEQRDQLVAALNTKYAALEDAVSEYNAKLAELREPLQHALDGYNEAVEQARGFAEDIASQIDNDIEDKSEKWQESERGEAAIAWRDEWQGIDLSEIDLDLPGDLEVEATDHAADLEALSSETQD